MMLLVQLFFEFFKTGLFAVGGGLATLPFLYTMSETTGWFSLDDIVNLVAISESTPGPMGINMATYVGYTTSGILGSIIAPLGLVVPSILIIVVIAKFLERFQANILVQYAFYGLRPASTALIAAAGCEIIKVALLDIPAFKNSGFYLSLFNIKAILLAILLLLATNKLKFHPIFYILVAAIVGIVLKY